MPDDTMQRPGHDDVFELLVKTVHATVGRLARMAGPPSVEDLREILFDELAIAVSTHPGLHVRGDRTPSTRSGSWRYSALIESADRVVAAIEISSAPDDIEYEAMALARLSDGLTRGVADRGFLVAASRRGHGLAGTTPGGGGQVAVSFHVSKEEHGTGEEWQLALTEARRDGEDGNGPSSTYHSP